METEKELERQRQKETGKSVYVCEKSETTEKETETRRQLPAEL